jgi:hypothetical protein
MDASESAWESSAAEYWTLNQDWSLKSTDNEKIWWVP